MVMATQYKEWKNLMRKTTKLRIFRCYSQSWSCQSYYHGSLWPCMSRCWKIQREVTYGPANLNRFATGS